MEKFNQIYLKVIELFKQNRKNIIVAVALIVLVVLIVLGFSIGSKNPIKTPELPEEKGGILEASFDRWYKGESGELLASFFLQNHSQNQVEKIDIVCVAFSADNKEINRFNQSVKLLLLPNEERVLNRTYIGKLDPLAQKVVCQISSWE